MLSPSMNLLLFYLLLDSVYPEPVEGLEENERNCSLTLHERAKAL